jgi:hypothetical protein
MRRRHKGYVALLVTCFGVLACLMLPRGLRQLAVVGYLALPLVLISALGMPIEEGRWPTLRRHGFRLLGFVTWVASLVWYLTPLSQTSTGVPLLVLWSVLVIWSCERLIRNLAQERQINREVLLGALAGYLLLGLAAPSFSQWTRNAQVRTVTDALQSGARLAQAEAVRRNRQVVFFLTNDAACAATTARRQISRASRGCSLTRSSVQMHSAGSPPSRDWRAQRFPSRLRTNCCAAQSGRPL